MSDPPPPPPVGRGGRAAAHREAQSLLQSKVAQFKNVMVRASAAACSSAPPGYPGGGVNIGVRGGGAPLTGGQPLSQYTAKQRL